MAEKKYFPGFDYLRVIFACAIVAWHTKIFGLTDLFSPLAKIGFFRPSLIDVIYLNIFLAGVPLFVQIALFLYIYNRQAKTQYFWQRINYLVLIYCFWVFWSTVFLNGQFSWAAIAADPLPFLVSGGYAHLYFLFALIVLTLIMEIMLKLQRIISGSRFLALQAALLVIFSLVLPLKLYLSGLISNPSLKFLLTNLGPVDFLPYVFAALLIFHFYQQGGVDWKNPKFKQFIAVMVSVYLTVAIAEWRLLPSDDYFTYNSMLLPPYARLSIVISTLLIFAIFLAKELEPPKIIRKLSELTFGIYVLHLFIMHNLYNMWPELFAWVSTKSSFVYYLTILALSTGFTYCIKKLKIL